MKPKRLLAWAIIVWSGIWFGLLASWETIILAVSAGALAWAFLEVVE